MSKLPRPSATRKSVAPSSRPSVSRPPVSRPSISRQSGSNKQSISRPSTYGRPSIAIGAAKVDSKGNTKKNVKLILDFLVEHEYPNILTRKNLMNPTEATFKDVLKFIVKDGYPNFECNRLCTDVSSLLHDLSYPYPIKESYFKPVGSPLSWPFLLEALAFLCNLFSMMEYETAHISDLYTINCEDEDDAEEELHHQVTSSRLYRMFQAEGTDDVDRYKDEYLKVLDIGSTVEMLQGDHERYRGENAALQEKNNKFPEFEADFNNTIANTNTEIAKMENDSAEFVQVKEEKRQEIAELEEQNTQKCEQLDVLKDEASQQESEIVRLEEIVATQPPQHEVQKIKANYYDLVDKRDNLQSENKQILEENSAQEIQLSKRRRELKEKLRRLLNDIQAVIPGAKLDLDRMIDNKVNLELNVVIDMLKKRTSDDKEESMKLDSKLFDQRIEIQRLEDDGRLESDSFVQAKHSLKQRVELSQVEREKCMTKSTHLGKELEEIRESFEKLRKQLKENESEETIVKGIEKENDTIHQRQLQIDIYRAILTHQQHELGFISQETEDELYLLAILLTRVGI